MAVRTGRDTSARTPSACSQETTDREPPYTRFTSSKKCLRMSLGGVVLTPGRIRNTISV